MSTDIPHFDINIKLETPEDDAVKLVCKLKSTWPAKDIKIKYFTAGISNFLMGCYLPEKPDDIVLIRIYGESSELFTDRSAERQAFNILHQAGLSAPMYCTFDNGMAYGYLKGKPLTQKMAIHDENIRKLIAQEMAKLHSLNGPEGDGKKVLFFFKKMDIFFSLCPDSFPDPEKQKIFQTKLGSKKAVQEEYDVLRSRLEKMDCPVVYSHNDLLLQNIVYDEAADKIGFIDYEYCFYNFQAFDIGNHFNEYAGIDEIDYNLYPNDEYQLSWIRTYLECYKKLTQPSCCEVTDEEVRNFHLNVQLCSLASHYFWGTWALLQAKYSKIDFDYLGYAVIRFEEYFRRKEEFKLMLEDMGRL
ncbi:ethanolamine kinase 1-like [Gigantopelta aegis]|uniref:ethanolamine kinase 1-like n=1 Tax=Gigantopelta aegis TaxID=1735272 RepID=UPI001B88A9F7|nr:ethanolamine kinase 1-like [Gigantopelta aegis]